MCTLEKRGNLFILTLTGNDEHRLNPTLIDAIRDALHRARVESGYGRGSPSALITTAHGKFFSNGYDLAWSTADPNRPRIMTSKFRSLVADLINLPMPTIAAVSGHSSAAGFVLALSHDYILMRGDRGFLYMNELDIGYKIPAWFTTVVIAKVGSAVARREIVLKAAKITAKAAVELGIIDSAHGSAEETVTAAAELGEKLVERKWNGHVYAQIRTTLFADVLGALGYDETVEDKPTANKTPVSRL